MSSSSIECIYPPSSYAMCTGCIGCTGKLPSSLEESDYWSDGSDEYTLSPNYTMQDYWAMDMTSLIPESVNLSDWEEHDEMLWQDYYSEDDPDYEYAESDTESYESTESDSEEADSEYGW